MANEPNFNPYIKDYKAYAYVGYDNNYILDKLLFNQQTFDQIKETCEFHLRGVHPSGAKIIIPYELINNAMNYVYADTKPPVGDPASNFILGNDPYQNRVKNYILETIQLIIKNVKDQYDFIDISKNYDIWNTNRGTFNKYGLDSTPEIKLNEKYSQNDMYFAIQY